MTNYYKVHLKIRELNGKIFVLCGRDAGTLATRNTKLKERVAKLEKVREAAEYTVLAMEWTDTDLNKALDNIKLLEDVRKTAEGYSIPGVTHKLNEVLDIAKRIEWVLADGSMILPKSGLHTLLKEAIKNCEVSDG